MRHSSQSDVDGFQPTRSVDEDVRGGSHLQAAADGELCTESFEKRTVGRVEWTALRDFEELETCIRSSCVELRLRGDERTPAPSFGVGSEFGRPLQERSGRGGAATTLRATS